MLINGSIMKSKSHLRIIIFSQDSMDKNDSKVLIQDKYY